MAEIKVSVPMEADLHARIKAIARKDKRSLSGYIVKLVEAHVAKVEKADA